MRHSKVLIPERPPQFVERAEVRAVLDAQSSATGPGRVVVVSAPTGHGKTAAVADWVRATDIPTAWVFLDEADRDETRWWRSVLCALRDCSGVPQDSALHRAGLSSSGTDRRWPRDVVAGVVEALEDLPGPLRLVLDDVHEIVGHPAQRALRALAHHPVRGLTLVLCSRVDPPIGLDRLRLAGRLGELRVDRLAFSVSDAERLFEQASLQLSTEQTTTLVERTEGWIAALRLVALSLQSAPDPSAVVAEFAGDDRSVADYLVDEVLSNFDERERRVIEATSACSPVAVDLARALTEDPAATEVLERLEATTAMVRATDRRREHYQTHELLRSHVLARLRRTDGERLHALYRRAATWHEAHDDAPSAVRFAVLAGDAATTEALLRTWAIELLVDGSFAALRGADVLLRSRGLDRRTGLVLGLAALERGGVDHAATLFHDIQPERPDDEPGTTLLRGIAATRLALARGRHREARQSAEQLTPDAVDDAPLRAWALATRGYAAATVEPERARGEAQEALCIAQDHDWPYLVAQAQTAIAFSHVYGDQLHTAVEHADAVLDLAARHEWKDTPWPAGALAVLAIADLLDGRPEQALANVTRADSAAAVHHAEYRNALAVVRGAGEYDTGRSTEGWQLLRAARLQALAEDLDDRHVAFAALLEQQAALGLGRAREASELAGAVASRLEGTGDGVVIRARQRWAATRDPGTRHRLGRALEGRLPFVTSLAATEALVLDAEIALDTGQQPLVRRRLREALAHIADHGTLRPLRYAPPPVHDYLEQRRGSFAAHDGTVARVLAAARQSSGPIRALTARERDVLELLPTMQSVDEIAADLAVSANTVKTHKQAIYQKLGADNRREAVARAHRAGLLARSD